MPAQVQCNFFLTNFKNLKKNLVNDIISDFYLIVFQVSYNERVTFIINQTPMLYKDILPTLSYINMICCNSASIWGEIHIWYFNIKIYFSLPRTINIRLANLSDTSGVENLVSTLMLNKSILEDLKQYNEARRDPVSPAMITLSFFTSCYGTIMVHVASIWSFLGP